jgi:hypothetical protein
MSATNFVFSNRTDINAYSEREALGWGVPAERLVVVL